MHAEPTIPTPALCLDLEALFADLLAHPGLVLNQPLLHTLDNLLAVQLISHVLLQQPLPMTLPIDIEHKWLIHHILVDQPCNRGRRILIVAHQVAFVEISAVEGPVVVTGEREGCAQVELQAEKFLTFSLRQIVFQDVQCFLRPVQVLEGQRDCFKGLVGSEAWGQVGQAEVAASID